ncbi:MAG TPA: hypothetical protein VKB65_08530 [Myxococcota bacterium]|nr:hypothetical protein [Myxococcota bacterium]
MKPERLGPRPRTGLGPAAGLALAALALALVFQGGLLFGGALAHFDWAIHWHYYDWLRIGFQEHGAWARFMNDAWHTANFVANAQSPALGPLVWLLAWLPTELYVKLLITLYTAIGVAGGFVLARDLGARPALAACAAVLWSCGGFFAAHVAVGHHWSLGAYWLPWLFLLARRGRDGSARAWLGVAVVQALVLLEGQHHPFLWQNGLVGLWLVLDAAIRRDARALGGFAAATLVGVCLAGVRVVPLMLEFSHYLPEDRIGGLPPGALLFSLTSRAQGPSTSGLGVVFDHGSGWWEYTFYLGWIGLVFVAVGAAAAVRREAALLAAGLVAALLCLDTTRFGFDLWETLRTLPVASSQRCPSRLLVLGLFAAIFASVVGWERLLAGGLGRRLGARRASGAFALLALVLGVDLVTAARPWQAAAVGPLQASRTHEIFAPRLLPPAVGRVEELHQGPNELAYRVESDRPGFLAVQVVWDRYGPDWRAEGFETVRAPSGHLAVRIPAGESEVVLRYRTPGLAAGAALSLATALGLGGWLLLRSRGPWTRSRAE